jgi:F0F1-type ATP synthase delta subunit
MFERVVIHYPAQEDALKQILKEMTSFRSEVIVKYISSLNLNDKQLAELFEKLEEGI